MFDENQNDGVASQPPLQFREDNSGNDSHANITHDRRTPVNAGSGPNDQLCFGNRDSLASSQSPVRNICLNQCPVGNGSIQNNVRSNEQSFSRGDTNRQSMDNVATHHQHSHLGNNSNFGMFKDESEFCSI
ncbi:hypothetical protein QAD02_016451 [Eretmocerus hayati]|uniref:Uncharacterized protein n=1 Tax=Eretmocerus hayati TaxID=131215 RepID=A0ACC2PAM9_9HYME|nr:hypothetical protein QAD02_016451 [Eretmocerus hayati]